MSEDVIASAKAEELQGRHKRVCLCELIWMVLGRAYNCEPETKARCLARAKRLASESAPSASAFRPPPPM